LRTFFSAGLSDWPLRQLPALRRSFRRHVEPCLSLAASCHRCAAGLALWLIAVLLNGHSTTGQPYSYLCYGGFLTGVVIARPLELSKVNFDPRSSTILVKILRYLLSVGLLILTLFALETIFLLVTYRDSMFWNLLEYVRFIAAGFVTVFLAPWVFTKIGWAGTLTDGTSSFAA